MQGAQGGRAPQVVATPAALTKGAGDGDNAVPPPETQAEQLTGKPMTEDDAMAEEKEEEEEEADEEGQASLERLRGGAPSGMWATHVGTSAETILRPGTAEEEAWLVQGAQGGRAPQVVATPAASTKEEVHIVLPPATVRPKTAAAMHTLLQEAMPPPSMHGPKWSW